MKESPEERTSRFAEPGVGVQAEERTVEMDRETLDEAPPTVTNDSAVHETEGTRKTEIYRNDYENALPAHYRLIRMIGRGGMSEVFLAEDERLGRNVAIKFLNSEFRRDPDRMRRFNREARAASALNHPNILTIHDIGENEGVQFIVSEFVDGETLGSRIDKGKLPLADAVRTAIQIASALAASHNAGIVHRDIKPDNIMIRGDGSVKVLDFGLAKETGVIAYNSNGAEAQTLETAATSPGLILGTPQYMSPEQARGRPLDARTDLFSFGVILFEMVTGKQPFPGSSLVDIIAAVIGNEPLPVQEYLDDPPDLLVRIIGKALRKNKDDRYATMDHLLSDLRDLQREVSDVPVTDARTLADEARDTRPATIRTYFGEGPLRGNVLLLLVVAIPVLAAAVWWLASGRSEAGPPTLSAGSMRMTPITNWSGGAGELVAAAKFSPDAKMIAFAATKTGATEIWVKPVSGGEPIQVTKNGFYNQYPIWSPDGQYIAFVSKKGNDRGIWKASFSGGEQIQIVGGVSGIARPLLWSTTGKIYFQDGSELMAADEKTGSTVRVTDLGSKGIKARTIELSDDEKQIAYSIKEEGGWKVKVSDLAGSNSSEIGSSTEQIDLIAWESSGKSVIYSASSNGAYQVFRSDIGSKEPKLLSNGNLDFFVQDVSANGTDILYGSVSETSDLWKVDIANANQSAVANDVSSEFWPDVSPDGNGIVYQVVNQADRPYRGSIKFKTLGSAVEPNSLSPEGFAPVWSPSGSYVAFFKRSESGISIWRVNADGSGALRLADGGISPPGYVATPYLKIGVGHLSWSPDGSSLVYPERSGGISNIAVVSLEGSKKSILTANGNVAENFCCTAWTADGTSLIAASEFTEAGPPSKRVYRLWHILVGSGEPRILLETQTQLRFLGISGEEVMFAERSDPTEVTPVAKSIRIEALKLKSLDRRPVSTLSDAYFQNIHLSHDGRTVAYVTRAKDMSTVWSIPVNGGPAKRLLEENDSKILISSLAWSRDGSTLILGKQTRTNLISMLSN